MRILLVLIMTAGAAFVYQRTLRTERQIAACRVAGRVEALAAARACGYRIDLRLTGEGYTITVTKRKSQRLRGGPRQLE